MSIELISVVSTENYMRPTLQAIRKSVSLFSGFDEVTIICPRNNIAHEFNERNVVFEHSQYSKFMLHELINYVSADVCVTIQYDSCIINPELWSDEFLEYDYIGAPWPNNWPNRVGNGGFSLRSRKFLEATAALPYTPKGIVKEHDAEDFHACITYFDALCDFGIKFAPVELARQFCVEHPIPECPHNYNDLKTYKSFAFHGEFNKEGMKFICQ